MRIDLHTHSGVSDGTVPPAALMQAARDAGLDVVGLTDHDTTDGWDEAAAAIVETGVALVRGIELSTRHDGMSVHLLCYLPRPDDVSLADELARIREHRRTRARRIVERIAADLPLTWDDVLAQSAGAVSVGRPHIADALVARGLVEHRDAAFATLLSDDGPYYVPHYAPATSAAVALVLAAGGVPVIAHPGARMRGRTLDDEAIASLATGGLVGLEVDHRDHDEAERTRLRGLAAELGLLVTGSSDWHGSGKLNRLGENLTDEGVLARIEELGALPVLRP